MGGMRILAPYMAWAKSRPAPRYDLAGSNVLACTIDDLDGARDAMLFSGRNENGYEALHDAIARRYGVRPEQVTTASGASGANFQVCAALLEAGDDVVVERPGYDPLLGAPRLLGANVIRFERRFEDGYALDPERVARAMTPRTRLVVVTTPHNPSGVPAAREALEAIGRLAESRGALVLVDEVYLDATGGAAPPAAHLGDAFISTSSLTKSYGLASLRCGWTLSSTAVAERIRRARDVIDGTGSIVTERLSVLAFAQLPKLAARASTLLSANIAIARAFFESHPELEVVLPAATTVTFPRLRGVADTAAFTDRLLADRGTAVVPGRFFEAPQHFRLGLATSTDVVRDGLAELAAALDRSQETSV
jgi:aspartate/methionine/tyrosine aminotransferase